MIRRLATRVVRGRPQGLTSLARQVTELAPPETLRIPPAIHVADSLARIRGLSPWRTWDQENELIRGGTVGVPACTAYRVDNADVVGALVYFGGMASHVGAGTQAILMDATAQKRVERANLVTTIGGSHYFGAKLLDDFVFELTAADPENNVRLASLHFEHEHRYRELLEIDRSRELRRAKIKHLTLFDEPNSCSTFRAHRYRTLRARMKANLPAGTAISSKVYLKRGASGVPRVLANEDRVEAFLRSAGFDIVEPSRLDVDEIAARTLGARVVVSVEGSHMSHAQFTMADDAAFVVIQPPDRFSAIYKQFTDCMEMSFGFVVGRPAEYGFTCDLTELGHVLDQVDARLGRLIEH